MNHSSNFSLMASDTEDDLVSVTSPGTSSPHSPPSPSSPTTSNTYFDIDTEMDRILRTPWYALSADQAQVISRLVSLTENVQMSHVELRNSIEDSLMQLAGIRGRSAQGQN